MEKEFVQYTETLELKKLGFNEPCFGYYIETGKWIPASYSKEGMVYPSNSDLFPEWVASPTYQQVFRWFRKKYNLYSFVFKFDEGFGYETYKEGVTQTNDSFDTYEEAELACLIKLIEIVKKEPHNDPNKNIQ